MNKPKNAVQIGKCREPHTSKQLRRGGGSGGRRDGRVNDLLDGCGGAADDRDRLGDGEFGGRREMRRVPHALADGLAVYGDGVLRQRRADGQRLLRLLLLRYGDQVLVVLRGLVLGQALDGQHLGRVQECGQCILLDVHLALVHVHDNRQQIVVFDVPEYDDRVLARILLENLLEVGAAGGQQHFVGANFAALAAQRHIAKVLLGPQRIECVRDVVGVVRPLQRELLTRCHFASIIVAPPTGTAQLDWMHLDRGKNLPALTIRCGIGLNSMFCVRI